ncbi:hypothetical protein J6590_035496 [Homalodisca vitripennis]|nr:hypothetical protein J6590_035496 [Homalodisca vitripennis]
MRVCKRPLKLKCMGIGRPLEEDEYQPFDVMTSRRSMLLLTASLTQNVGRLAPTVAVLSTPNGL